MNRRLPREPGVDLVGTHPIDRVRGIGLWGEAWRRLRRNRPAFFCGVIVLIYIVVAGLVALRWIATDNWNYEREVPPGSIAVLSVNDVRDWQGLAQGLKEAADKDPEDPARRVWDRLPSGIRGIVLETNPSGGGESIRRDRVVEALNAILKDTGFSNAPDGATHSEILRAGHVLLRQAFPNVFGPVRRHWMGTNWNGTDVFTLMIYGTRAAVTVAIMATTISITIGVILGALAGYFRGFVDDLIIWLYTTFQSVPGILLIIAFAVVLKNVKLFGMELSGLPTVYVALGMTDWVGICRLIRGETLKHREQEYVQAARAFGMGHGRIIFRHILPNVSHLVIITFSLGFVSAIHTEVILTYLGLGAKDKTWGTMINNATQVLSKGIWWEMAAATVAIFVVSLALNIWGDALRDALDPKLKT